MVRGKFTVKEIAANNNVVLVGQYDLDTGDKDFIRPFLKSNKEAPAARIEMVVDNPGALIFHVGKAYWVDFTEVDVKKDEKGKDVPNVSGTPPEPPKKAVESAKSK